MYSEESQSRPIELTTHQGQECDLIIKGTLKVQIGNHVEVLHEGDAAYYDSGTPHGMIATGGEDCLFYAIVLNPNGEPSSSFTHSGVREFITLPLKNKPARRRVWEDFISVKETETGELVDIKFKNEDKFNFAFDVIDKLGTERPDKLAILHLDRNKTERRFTFGDLKRLPQKRLIISGRWV